MATARRRRRKLPFGFYINIFKLTRKRPWLRPLLKAGYRAGLFKIGRPYMVMLALTYRCQCRCSHCGIISGRLGAGTELTTDETKRIIDDLADMRVSMVNFFGGEPLLRADCVELVGYAHDRGLSTRLDSNGLALTKELARELAAAGLDEAYISLDSPDAAEHDANRGIPGSFEKAVEAVKACVAEGIDAVISTCTSKESLFTGKMEQIVRLAGSLGAKVRIMQPVLTGKILDCDDKALGEEEERKIRSLLKPDAVFWESEECAKKDAPFFCHSTARLYAYISCYGDVQPCCYVPLSFGNVRVTPFREIIRHMWSKPFFGGDRAQCLSNTESFREQYKGNLEECASLPLRDGSLDESLDEGETDTGEWDRWAPHFAGEVDPILAANDEALLDKIPAGAESILDAGCGTGRLTAKLAARAKTVTAMDFSPQMVQRAREGMKNIDNIEYICGGITDFDFAGRTFDVVVLSEVFHHLPRAKALARLQSLVKPGGRLILMDGLRATPRDVNRFGLRLLKSGGLAVAVRSLLAMHFSPRLKGHLKKEKYLSANEFRRYFPVWLPGAGTAQVNGIFAMAWWDRPEPLRETETPTEAS